MRSRNSQALPTSTFRFSGLRPHRLHFEIDNLIGPTSSNVGKVPVPSMMKGRLQGRFESVIAKRGQCPLICNFSSGLNQTGESMRPHIRWATITCSIMGIALTACSSGSGGASAPGATLNVDVLQPFSGVNAIYGPGQDAGCYTAEKAINNAGGILGHHLACVNTDDKGDAADAVPITTKMLASTSNLIAVLGPGNTAPVEVPLITAAHVPMFTNTTDPRYDKVKNRYFFRILPSDSLAGISLAYWAYKHGFTHAAGVFTSDLASQTNVPSLKVSYKQLGGHMATMLTLQPGQSSYRTEVESLIAAHPDAILSDMDNATAATFFANLKALDPHMPQIVFDSVGEDGSFRTVLKKVLGPSALSHIVAIGQTPATATPGYKLYGKLLSEVWVSSGLASALGKSNLAAYQSSPYSYYGYDALILEALAMTEAKTTVPSKVLHDIISLTKPSPGAVTVHTYAQGVQALKAGKRIYYLGAYGPIYFNQYQNSSAPFTAVRGNTPSGPLTPVPPQMSAPLLNTLLQKTGL